MADTAEKESPGKESPPLLWACFLNWSYTLEKMEESKLKESKLPS